MLCLQGTLSGSDDCSVATWRIQHTGPQLGNHSCSCMPSNAPHLCVAPDETEHQAHCSSGVGKVASAVAAVVSVVTKHTVADAYAPADAHSQKHSTLVSN